MHGKGREGGARRGGGQRLLRPFECTASAVLLCVVGWERGMGGRERGRPFGDSVLQHAYADLACNTIMSMDHDVDDVVDVDVSMMMSMRDALGYTCYRAHRVWPAALGRQRRKRCGRTSV